VTARDALIRRQDGTTWGATAHTLLVSSLALVCSTAEYADLIWARSCHAKKLDTTKDQIMRCINGYVKPTPVETLPVLSGIIPAPFRRKYYKQQNY